ncbi:CRISPR-associated endonuclease Cas2 [Desemzia sp. C1]|uniref:CRISPR-associated endonuclease Cas2 n=1 Tax=Desemzia TaxID=82800 RepID=UPI001CB73EB8|nr:MULTISPECIES: CRISPR-associated endonuclease Cas2 [Desemzia]MCI3028207.1 CRISPR-associated endonuclease Cas2 [Desemzia sp. C1]
MASPYKFMRLMLFFDLPMNTKPERRTYARFRKYLINNGFTMVQFSVYAKIFPNRSSLDTYMMSLRNNLPAHGSVRAMAVTEKQYNNMFLLVGNKTLVEETLTDNPMVIL